MDIHHLRVPESVDTQLGGWVRVFGEPDVWNRVIVNECVVFEKVREIVCLSQAGCVPVGLVLSSAPVGADAAAPRSRRPNPPFTNLRVLRTSQRHRRIPRIVSKIRSLRIACTLGAVSCPPSPSCVGRDGRGGISTSRLIAAMSFHRGFRDARARAQARQEMITFKKSPQERRRTPRTAASSVGVSITNQLFRLTSVARVGLQELVASS